MGNTISGFYNAFTQYIEDYIPNSQYFDGYTVFTQTAPKKLQALQGSSTYLAKTLGLDQGVFTSEEFVEALEQYLVGIRKSVEEGGVEIGFTDMVNALYAVSLLENDILCGDSFIAQREFVTDDGEKMFTSFWAGYAADLLETSEGEPFYLVDAGTGELKYFKVSPNKEGGFSSTGQHASHDGAKFIQLLSDFKEDDDYIKNLVSWIQNPEGVHNEGNHHGKIHIAGCQALRTFRASNMDLYQQIKNILETKNIFLEVVEQEYESACEMQAVKTAIETCVGSQLEDMELFGNFAWGNGSTQARELDGTTYNYECGLNTWKNVVRNEIGPDEEQRLGGITITGEGRKEKLEIQTVEDFDALVEVIDEAIENVFA